MHRGFRKTVKSWLGPSPTPSVDGGLQPSPTHSRRTSPSPMRAAPYPTNAAPTGRYPGLPNWPSVPERRGAMLLGGSTPGRDSIVVPTINFPPSTSTVPSVEKLQSAGMSALEMFQCLTRHGCPDLTADVDMEAVSSNTVATGAYGDIWKGKLYDGTEVAIKVWRFHWASEKPHKSIKGAMREIYNWTKLDHVNIHGLLGVLMFDNKLAMVSKWMENGNLQEYIRRNKTVDRHQLCIQVTGAVQYLHSHNMIHGDLKACNFLVSPDGVARLTDFDRSVVSDRSLVFSQTTSLGGGTLRWMAPELVSAPLDSNVNLDQRSKQADVYALAMTLLEIITGDVPYSECRRDVSVYSKIGKGTPPERSVHFQNARGERMWELLMQCWGRDPASRLTAQQLLESLQALD